MRPPRLTDGVIVLDGHTLSDVESHLAGEDDELARRFGWFPARSTEATVKAAILRWREGWRVKGSTRAFAIRDGALVGGCEIRLAANGIAAMSYWIFPAHRRRGYATRAVRLAGEYAFRELTVRVIELHIARDNAGSRGVAVRAGFEEQPGPAGHGELGPDEVLYVRRHVRPRPPAPLRTPCGRRRAASPPPSARS